MDIQNYFETMETEVKRAYDIANKARAKGNDPESFVDIPLAKNIFERVEGLIGAVKPELIGSGLAKRIAEVEAKYRSGDWRVALVIAEEVAKGNFCKFKDDTEAIEVGIRVGLAYATMGVVSAPLEGFIEFKIKDRRDGGKYGSAYFAGPIRAAGGTAAAVTLLITDYLRRKFNLLPFDITPDEIARTQYEIEDYHAVIARLQYFPNHEEVNFLLSNVPIEINGDPTSEREVLVHKDLARVGTPRIRGGMCLVLCEGLAQKAKKIVKNIEKWGKEFGLEDWAFLKEYIDLQKKVHSIKEKPGKEDKAKIQPNYVYIDETVAGRPIFSYPLVKGGFRLRYGRTRLTGLAAAAVNPATMHVLENFIATGAQLRIERPGKACAITPCDSIDGPIVKLYDESVVKIDTEDEAIRLHNQIKEIIFLGDLMFAYGEFARNNHVLVPSPYVEEWWIQELENAAKQKGVILPTTFDEFQAAKYSLELGVALYPKLIFYYSELDTDSLLMIYKAIDAADISKEGENYKMTIPHDKTLKKAFELIGMPHKISDKGIIVENESALGLLLAFAYLPEKNYDIKKAEVLAKEGKTPLEIINTFSKIKIMDKTGIYVGARLGRPEKAKQRKLTGRPQVLFPVGTQGGRMRSVNEALSKGFIEADFPAFKCDKCDLTGIYPRCEKCGDNCRQLRFCSKCKKETNQETHCGGKTNYSQKRKVDIRVIMDKCADKLGVSIPQLIKGVRGTSNKKKIPEPIEKGILRAIHGVYVNKDGTVRYDAIETPITHFKPKEIGTQVLKLRQMGYLFDIYGEELKHENQVLELMPQDVVLPDCKEWPDASAMDTIYNTAGFVDDLLEKYYGTEKYYNIHSPSDMVGQLIIALAPHTSAGIIGRIVGFSKTQCFFAHPYLHSACRRNCDGDELAFMLLMDALLNFSRQYLPDKRGGRAMDAPLVLTTRLNPEEVDDEVYNMDIAEKYPLDFYYATREWKSPYEVTIKQIQSVLGKPEQYQGMMYTHAVNNMNSGNRVSAYKTLSTIMDKVHMQMELSEKVRAVDKSDVAKILIEKHFLKDIKGNLRRYSTQEFRCISCNQKYRRIPLMGRCDKCSGKLVLTVAEGTVSKYLEPSIDLAEKYSLPSYLSQTLEILRRRVDAVFGKEPTKQTGLKKFFG